MVYETGEAAETALQLNGTDILGSSIIVTRAPAQPEQAAPAAAAMTSAQGNAVPSSISATPAAAAPAAGGVSLAFPVANHALRPLNP